MTAQDGAQRNAGYQPPHEFQCPGHVTQTGIASRIPHQICGGPEPSTRDLREPKTRRACMTAQHGAQRNAGYQPPHEFQCPGHVTQTGIASRIPHQICGGPEPSTRDLREPKARRACMTAQHGAQRNAGYQPPHEFQCLGHVTQTGIANRIRRLICEPRSRTPPHRSISGGARAALRCNSKPLAAATRRH